MLSNLSIEPISTQIVDSAVYGACGALVGYALNTNPVASGLLSASYQLIKTVCDKAFSYLADSLSWNEFTHKNTLRILKLSTYVASFSGSLALTSAVTGVAVPIIDALAIILCTYALVGAMSVTRRFLYINMHF